MTFPDKIRNVPKTGTFKIIYLTPDEEIFSVAMLIFQCLTIRLDLEIILIQKPVFLFKWSRDSDKRKRQNIFKTII